MSAASGLKPLGSLRGQLLRWLLVPLGILVAINAVSVYRNALDAADLAYDRSLLASTRALAERVSIVNGRVETDMLGRLYYKVTGTRGEFVSGYEDLPALPANVPRSDIYPALVRFYHASYRGEQVRIAALYQPVYDDSMRGIALIQVGESLEARQELSRSILVDTLWRQAALVLTAALLAWFAVRLVLRPLMLLKADAEGRAPTDLSNFNPALVHKEVRPLVTAMNGYMARLQTLIAGQRRFIGDASHQLRTPLTVLKMQAELAMRATDLDAMREIVQGIARTTDSTVHLANRLLTTVRAGHGFLKNDLAPVSLTEAVRHVGIELGPLAVEKGIDLSLEADGEATIEGDAVLLHEMLANLVDNAIRYTPPGGTVILRVSGTPPLLEVEDTGVGIEEADRERVFSPFHRGTAAQQMNAGGSGLGLTIVRDIAASHGARIEFGVSPKGGLLARVHFPIRSKAAA
jgi:two-component system sensor histidine kinase TctE